MEQNRLPQTSSGTTLGGLNEWIMMIRGEIPEDDNYGNKLGQLVGEFIFADWDKSKQLLIDHQEMLTSALATSTIEQLIREPNFPEQFHDTARRKLHVLQLTQQFGIEKAFAFINLK